jgi:TonB family protein
VNTTITVSLVVNENGMPQDIQVVHGAGFGLDESAIRAIQAWRFEPGAKEGKPFRASTHVELNFSVLDKAHAGQTARLNFSLAPGVQRPELIEGKIPSNPDQPGNASLRIRFTVSPDGQPKNFQTFETDNREWTDRALQEMAGWRFRPAMRNGQPEEVNGLFELSVGQTPAPGNHPTLTRRLVAISPPEPQDASLPDRDAWNTESQGIAGTAYEVTTTETTFDFVGAQPGRWRVWPVSGSGRRGNPSAWRTFRYVD